MTTKSTRPSSNAGPETAGPSTIANVGTRPEHFVNSLAATPQPCSGATPSAMSAPELFTTSTTGMSSSSAVRKPSVMIVVICEESGCATSLGSNSIHITFRSSSRVTRAETGAGIPVTIPTSSRVMAARLDVGPGEKLFAYQSDLNARALRCGDLGPR